MPATISIYESNTPAPHIISLGSSLLEYAYKNRDAPATIDTFDKDIFPCLRPNSDYWYSFVKWFRFRIDNIGGATSISSFKVWQSATPPDGCEVFITQGGTYEVITSGKELPTISGSPSPAAMTIMTGNYTTEGTALTIGGTLTDTYSYSNYFSHCIRIATSADLGELDGSWTLSYSYVEV